MLVAAYFAAGDERVMRVAAAFDWNGVLAPANIRVDAWVTPPNYTGKPPVILSARTGMRPRPIAEPRCRCLQAARCWCAPAAAPSMSWSAAASPRSRRANRRRRGPTNGISDRGRRHRPCPRAGRPAAVEVCCHARPGAEHLACQGSGTPGPRLAADVLQARGRLRRHRSPRAIRRPQPRCGQGPGKNAEGRRYEGRQEQGRRQGPTAAAVRGAQFALVLPNAPPATASARR